MFSLVIDTAFETCQVGLWHDDVCLNARVAPGGGKHDVVLAPLVAAVLREEQLTVADLDRIIVTIGPGRFTGLRVGIAFARGLALVYDTPVVPVLTTDALCHDVLQAGRGEGSAIIVAVKRGESFIRRCQPEDAAPVQVMDTDFAATLAHENIKTVAGILSPELKMLLPALPQVEVLETITEPTLAAIFFVGSQAVENKNKPVRPYYNA